MCSAVCTVWKNEKFSITKKISRQINFLVKSLLSRNFCQKSVRINRSNFHTVVWKLRKNLHSLSRFLANILWKKVFNFRFAKYRVTQIKIKIALSLNWSISDPMLVKPKLVWEAVVFFPLSADFCYIQYMNMKNGTFNHQALWHNG